MVELKDVLSGTFAGIVGTCVGHPLDTIKTRLQTRNTYKNAFDCAYQVGRHEGFLAFYRGIGSPLVGLTILNSASFGAYAHMRNVLQEFNSTHKLESKSSTTLRVTAEYAAAGAFSGLFITWFSTPMERIKVKLQTDSAKVYKNSFQCLKEIFKTQGLAGVYRGFYINTIREITFGAAYFAVYETLKLLFTEAFRPKHENTFLGQIKHKFSGEKPPVVPGHSLAVFLAGGAGGVCGWLASFPLDVVKAQIMSTDKTKGMKEKRIHQVFHEIWSKQGIGAFYRGVGPTLVRAAIVSSTRFSAFEYAEVWLGKYI